MRRDDTRASKEPHAAKSWAAYKISGSTPIAYGGVIFASTKVEAEDEAYAVFKAYTPRERALVYVREADFNER